ncbi:MAG TPA: hypothetical protein VFL85_03075 [Candidatus Saccharimonadales bacterium]|nr:hypothetical protein [Candidatus Saccharimonadales bacterium]
MSRFARRLQRAVNAPIPPVIVDDNEYWTVDSAIRLPIPNNPVLDSKSAGIVSNLSASGSSRVLDCIEYGVTIRVANGETRKSVTVLNSPAWGPDPFQGRTIPLASSWKPAPGGDGALVVVDGTIAYGFWEYSWNGGSPQCSFGGYVDTSGSIISDTKGNATGAGLSRLAGIIRRDEMAAGVINHALVFSSDMVTATNYKFPAIKTDGKNMAGISPTIMESARIQLDPAYNVDGDSSLKPYERMVAKALQKYGAYCMDNGGARMAFIAETPLQWQLSGGNYTPVNDTAYQAAGIANDYPGLSNIPWNRLRVLANWDGS